MLKDRFDRRFPYLRLSVTEACNFRCAYCLPDGYHRQADQNFLSVPEIRRLAEAFAGWGVTKIRLTGGEPSARKDLTAIIQAVAAAPGVATVAMTTNGWNLARRSREWRSAGLTHINVSLDSLDANTFAVLTGWSRHRQVLEGVEAALEEGFIAVKLNAVLLRETVEHDLEPFAEFLRNRSICVRFIELMRTNENKSYFQSHHLSGQVLRAWLSQQGWTPASRGPEAGPALEFEHPGYKGRFGLIAPYTPGFCGTCNRLRVTARGQLRLCLFGDEGIDLRDLLQSDQQRGLLHDRVTRAVEGKAASHRLLEGNSGDIRNLAQTGG